MIYNKTELGKLELKNNQLGLSVFIRRVLIMLDGQKTIKEIEKIIPQNEDINTIINNLLDKKLIEQVAEKETSIFKINLKNDKKTEEDKSNDSIYLPPISERTFHHNEMARNFMVNTINNIHGQYTRLSTIKNILDCKDTESLRNIVVKWEACIIESKAGAKKLSEFKARLYEVL